MTRVGKAVALGGIFGTPRLPSTPSTTPKFNLIDRSKLRERHDRRFQDPDDALDQLDGVSREQDRFRQGVRQRPIDSIEKSKKRFRDATRGLAAKTRRSLEELAEVFEDVRHYLDHGRQPKPKEPR